MRSIDALSNNVEDARPTFRQGIASLPFLPIGAWDHYLYLHIYYKI